VRNNSAPPDVSAESCGIAAPLTVKLAPGRAWKPALSAGLLTKSCAQARRLNRMSGLPYKRPQDHYGASQRVREAGPSMRLRNYQPHPLFRACSLFPRVTCPLHPPAHREWHSRQPVPSTPQDREPGPTAWIGSVPRSQPGSTEPQPSPAGRKTEGQTEGFSWRPTKGLLLSGIWRRRAPLQSLRCLVACRAFSPQPRNPKATLH
jgi:hypothetical protein